MFKLTRFKLSGVPLLNPERYEAGSAGWQLAILIQNLDDPRFAEGLALLFALNLALFLPLGVLVGVSLSNMPASAPAPTPAPEEVSSGGG